MMKTMLAALAVLVGLNGVAAAQYPPPPPMYQEHVPRHPGTRYVWHPGHWQWNGFNYVWVRGRYVVVAQHLRQRQWVHGHWNHGQWVPPHWR